MERGRVNVAVGIFVVIGILALGYLSIKLGRVSFLGNTGYTVTVDFPGTGGLKAGSSVEIAGVEIGRVESIALVDYQARVTVRIQSGVLSGARFWKNGSAAIPSTNRLRAIGRPPAPRSAPSATAR